jgi:hypothetical protein
VSAYSVVAYPGPTYCTWTSGPLGCTMSDLAPGWTYKFVVSALNGAGLGLPSSVPDAPRSVAATPGNGSAAVSWSSPADPGLWGVVIESRVVSSPGGAVCQTRGASCTVTGLANGVAYAFTVSARGLDGYGPPSSPSTAVTPVAPHGVPGKPTGATGVAGNGSVFVSWLPPAVGGGLTITRYTVTSSPGSKQCTWTSGPLSCSIIGLTNGTPYVFTVTATNGLGTGPASDPSASVTPGAPTTDGSGTYHAISPVRILDSRPDATNRPNIGLSGKFVAGTVRTFAVAAAKYVGGGTKIAVPANAIAVTGNLTMTGGSAAGIIALGPTMTPTGDTTTLNFSMTSAIGSENRANNMTMGLAPDGTLSAVFRSSQAGATVDLILDVTGYFLPDTTGATYHPLAPGRVLDTRKGAGHIGLSGKFATGVVRTISVAGVKGLGWSSPLVPASATAITANLTVTNATSNGYVAIGPTTGSSPSTSTVNVLKAHNTANGVTVALRSGKVQAVWVGTRSSSADVILDVTGYFAADASGLRFYPVTPYRGLDTSTNLGLTGSFTTGTARTLAIGGLGGSAGVPTDAKGIAGNLTVVRPSTVGYAFIAPSISGTLSSSTVNANAGVDTANGFDVSLNGSGQVALIWKGQTGSAANLQMDINGYWR